ncbi:MAG: B12-binding domain-containing radical SAM protein [Armatimonadetes bacterium]|nr:B12-binding domain-containing radical SAM protein [Armatimonadota bacterium]
MKPKTLLVKYNEDTNIRPIPDQAEKTLQVYPALGIMYIAAVLRQEGFPVEILDAHVYDLYGADFQKAVADARPHIIGFTSTTVGWPNVVEAARLAREAVPEAFIIVGGPQLQIYPKESISFPWIDMAVTGDGEETILEIVKRFDGGGSMQDILGTCVKVDGEVRLNPPRQWTRKLDDLPFPAVDLTPWDKYHALTIEKPFFNMITTRGCPYKCSYCSQVYAGDTIRYRSAENVLEEMEIYVKKYGAREIIMFDETFTVKKTRVMKICEGILERKLKFGFDVRTRVDCVDDEMLQALKAAGCKRIHFGIESGSPRILEAMNKGITVDKIKETVTLAKKRGFSTRGFFMIGYLDEDMSTYKETLDLSQSLPLDYASYSITTPLPHTGLYREAMKRGYVDGDYWRDYTLLKKDRSTFPHIITEHWDEDKLRKMLSRAYSGFYLRPKYVWRRISSIRSWQDIQDLMSGLKIIRLLQH